MPSCVPPDSEIESEAQRQKTALLYRNAGIAQSVTVINASLLAYVNATLHTPVGLAFAWWCLIVTIAAGRYLLARRFHAIEPNAVAAMTWRHRYVGTTAMAAATWGAATVLFMWDVPDGAQLFTGLVLAGMVAGAIPILAPVPAAFRIFTLPILVPASLVILLQADSALDWAFGSMTVVFLAAVLASARYLHETLDVAIRLGLDQGRLVGNLENARDSAEAALAVVAARTRALADEIRARTAAEQELLRHKAGLEQQVAERTAQLRRTAENTRLFIKHAPIAIAMFDRDMNYLAASDRWVTECGRGSADLIGRNHYVINPDLPDEWKRVHQQALAGATIKKDEDQWHQANGNPQWLRWAVLPWTHPDGQIGGIIISAEDITARKLNELALVDANRNKDEFLAMLAHELRNPLMPISLAAHVLEHPGLDEKRSRWAVATISDQVKHITRLVDDLLDVSRISLGRIELKRETVELADLAMRAAEAVRPSIEAKGHQLVMKLPDEPVYLDADEVRMTQVLVNLLDNAAKYTPEGGHIELSARVINQEIEIAVRDDGPGLSPALLPHVFELFRQGDRTLDRSQGGLGIGLNLAERMVHLHGGRIRAESPGPGKGSVFTVCLPTQAAVPDPAAGQSVQPPAYSGMRVLVVDDDPLITASMSEVLGLHDYVVRVAYSGNEALELVPVFQPQAILLDIGLVGMDGYETARRLRSMPGAQPCRLIAISGYGTAEAMAQSKAAGFDAHLVKPVKYEQIVAELNQAETRKTVGDPSAAQAV